MQMVELDQIHKKLIQRRLLCGLRLRIAWQFVNARGKGKKDVEKRMVVFCEGIELIKVPLWMKIRSAFAVFHPVGSGEVQRVLRPFLLLVLSGEFGPAEHSSHSPLILTNITHCIV